MESAIPAQLQTTRTTSTSRPVDFEPPVPAYVGRFSANTTGVSVAYFGFQSSLAQRDTLLALMKTPQGPLRIESGRDGDSEIVAAYWETHDGFATWFHSTDVQSWWHTIEDAVWLEAFAPSIDRFETLQSHQGEGVGILGMAEKMSEPIIEHNYWGGSRDRLAISQTDLVMSTGTLQRSEPTPGRVTVTGHGNLAVIRSGQDWSGTSGEERELYLNTVEPNLRAGMAYLASDGKDIGCYECRYVRDDASETSYGYAIFRDLADLESWAKSHETHLAIFGTFLQVAEQLGGNITLKLYHEVAVVNAEACVFEYINCRPNTGLLGAVPV